MIDSTTQFLQYLRAIGHNIDADFAPRALQTIIEMLMDIEVSRMIDASHYERNEARIAYRNGYRQRYWKTPDGKISLNIPKLRKGTYTPDFLSDELTASLLQLIYCAYIYGASPRMMKMWQVPSMLEIFSSSEIARVQDALADFVQSYQSTDITRKFPYIWLDTLTVGDAEQVAVIAIAFDDTGKLELLGFEVTSSPHDLFFWRLFLQNLVNRGLQDVELVVSDNFRGIKVAVDDVLGADWRYSHAEALRHVLDDIHDNETIIDAIATVFVQPDYGLSRVQMSGLVDSLYGQYPSAMLTLDVLSAPLLASLYADTPPIVFYVSYALLRVKQIIAGRQADAVAVSMIDTPTLSTDSAFCHQGGIHHVNDFVVHG